MTPLRVVIVSDALRPPTTMGAAILSGRGPNGSLCVNDGAIF